VGRLLAGFEDHPRAYDATTLGNAERAASALQREPAIEDRSEDTADMQAVGYALRAAARAEGEFLRLRSEVATMAPDGESANIDWKRAGRLCDSSRSASSSDLVLARRLGELVDAEAAMHQACAAADLLQARAAAPGMFHASAVISSPKELEQLAAVADRRAAMWRLLPEWRVLVRRWHNRPAPTHDDRQYDAWVLGQMSLAKALEFRQVLADEKHQNAAHDSLVGYRRGLPPER
jgi:hypothetical protein